jgi:hypothetical protein
MKKIKGMFAYLFLVILSCTFISFYDVCFANEIIRVANNRQLQEIYESCQNYDTYFVVVDASKWKNSHDFYHEIGNKFNFPKESWGKYRNMNAFEDWMRDLSWISQERIVILIRNLRKCHTTDSAVNRRTIFDSFCFCILPYWEGLPNTCSVVDCTVGGKPKQFDFYYY